MSKQNSKFRKEQYLPKLKSQVIPKKLLFFDTETKIQIDENNKKRQVLCVGSCIYLELNKDLSIKKRDTYVFHSKDEFISILLKYDKKRTKITAFAHNTGFDVQVLGLPKIFSNLGLDNDMPILNQALFIWSVKLHKGSILFLDTYNYVQLSLEKIGNDLGFPKLEIDFDTCTIDELTKYCARDSEIIEMFILKMLHFLVDNELGSFKTTIASLAMTAYRTRFMNKQPYIHTDERITDLERKAYFGGRTEIFKQGTFMDDTFHALDINSAYAYSMLSDCLPIELLFREPTLPEYNFEFHLKYNYVIADVLLNTKIAAFPKRIYNPNLELTTMRHTIRDNDIKYIKNKVLFPIGIFRTCLHHCELVYALKHNLIEKVYEYYVYTKGSLFKDYINFFYEGKQLADKENNTTDRLINKLYLTNLYGKFGQLYRLTECIGYSGSSDYKILDVIIPKENMRLKEIHWFGKVYTEHVLGEATYSNVAIAGAITAQTRMNLWKYICEANRDNVYYTDTDSLYVNSLGYDNLKQYVDSTRLGYLKDEGISDYITIRRLKDYDFWDKTRIKGVPKGAIQLDENTFQYNQFEGFRTWLSNGADREPLLIEIVKSRVQEYNKGYVDYRTGIVYPHEIIEV